MRARYFVAACLALMVVGSAVSLYVIEETSPPMLSSPEMASKSDRYKIIADVRNSPAKVVERDFQPEQPNISPPPVLSYAPPPGTSAPLEQRRVSTHDKVPQSPLPRPAPPAYQAGAGAPHGRVEPGAPSEPVGRDQF